MLTQDRLKEVIHYDPITGAFTWKTKRHHGRPAGWKERSTQAFYIRIMIDEKPYLAHRLSFLYMTGEWPPNRVDHKDGDTLNNAFNNLRLATASQNAANRSIDRRNTSGYKGVSFYKPLGKWVAHIRHNYKLKSLGYFHTKEDAAEAYRKAAEEVFGEFSKCD